MTPPLTMSNNNNSNYYFEYCNSNCTRDRPQRQRPRRRTNSILYYTTTTATLAALICSSSSLFLSTVHAQEDNNNNIPNVPEDIPALSVGGFVDSEFCYEALVSADEDADQRITQDEYITFAQAVSPPGLIDDVTTFDELPFAFTSTFRNIACLCQVPTFGGDANATECCKGDDAYIRVPAEPTAEDTSKTDIAYLYAACYLTEGAAQSILESPSPTVAPTTTSTTASPTSTPTMIATTIPPTFEPTVAPTEVPGTPTATPTATPTILPTAFSSPTGVPTTAAAPTVSPTASPTTTTPAPTAVPTTTSPTTTLYPTAPTRIERDAQVTYQVAVTDTSVAEESYLSDLNVAMDSLAQIVWAQQPVPDQRRRQRRRQQQREQRDRKLLVTVQRPTNFGDIVVIDCPPDLTQPGDACYEVTSIVTLTSFDEDITTERVMEYEGDLFDAIYDGELQTEIDALGRNTPIQVLTGPATAGGEEDTREISSDDSLSGGAAAGIAIAGAVVLVAAALLVSRRRRPVEEDEEKVRYAEYRGEDSSTGNAGNRQTESKSVASSSVYTDTAPQLVGVDSKGATNLGAEEFGKMESGQDIVAEPGMEHYEEEDSSQAGSSGWSSSAGVSSLNTGSVDDSMDAAAAAGATLAALGVGSALSRTVAQKAQGAGSSDDVSGVSSSVATREQLDDLIEAGDWAAVGATAALLAAASDSQSASSRSRATTRSGTSSDLDAARAAELDQLVDAGDWEGVVLAAARFQSSDANKSAESAGSGGGTSGSAGSTGTGDSLTGTGTGTGELSTNLSDSPSKTARREEIRAEVEALVRRVVPEEIDNIDEMMKQFKGREEELVETLRTMQERAVAQKARTAGQRAAKVKAKQSVQRGVVPGAEAAAQRAAEEGAASAGAIGGGIGAILGGAGIAAIATAAASDAPSSPKSKAPKETRSALELAIEAGDWEAVGQAAAMMEEGSVDTVSTGELDRIADASLSDSEGSFQRKRSQLSGVNAERAKQLDAMIDVGDWKGVMNAASQFSASDRKGKMSKEEEEALKEAEAWMKIAQETKAGGATDAGASDAAEWAIQRSLSQMKEAEKKKPAEKGEEDEV